VEFILQRWRELGQIQREKIIIAIAKLIRRIHNLNIVLPDLAVWHIFISEDHLNGQCQLSVIDLHRMTQNVQSQTKKIKDLGKFFWSMSEKYFDNELKNLFLDAYMSDNWRGSKADFAKKVRKRAAVIAKRRKPKRY
jgi:tRNA A-37 threonylcarbamoyl transferase component Bud32